MSVRAEWDGEEPQLTVHLGNLCTAWTAVDEHTSTVGNSALSIVLILTVSVWNILYAGLGLTSY